MARAADLEPKELQMKEKIADIRATRANKGIAFEQY
jgi:hypothetical protein